MISPSGLAGAGDILCGGGLAASRRRRLPNRRKRGLSLLIRSMTGYGRGDCPGENYSVTVELRSINHRYADFFLRIPREIHAFEDRIRSLLKREIRRGRVEVNITLNGSPPGGDVAVVNEELAAVYARALNALVKRLRLPVIMNMSVGDLLQLPGVLQAPGAVSAGEDLWPVLKNALQQALEGLVEHRNEEGANLSKDLDMRLEQIGALVEELAGFAPAVLEEQKTHLEKKLAEMLGAHFDRGRILMECAILAERADIHEEIVRMKSHLEAFGGTLRGEGPAGRRLDFMAQEFFREINTAGAKSQDYRIAALVVEIKTELEKMREQVQNIE